VYMHECGVATLEAMFPFLHFIDRSINTITPRIRNVPPT
jgi:hypothetical protein